MKKYIIIILILLIPNIVYARNDKLTVKLNKCIDGDTAIFSYNDITYKVRFLAIDTKELNSDNKYALIASNFTCQKLRKAKTITIEFDLESDEKDKYDRYLAWVFVDNTLLQKELVKNGYAEVKYLYEDYKYTNILKKEQLKAQKKKIGIWSNNQKKSWEDYLPFIYSFIIILSISICITIIKIINIKRKYISKIK